jgi:hypothetical protein
MGVGFKKLDKYIENKWDIEHDINDADLVVGIGRSLYDGMACGRTVVSYDKRPYRDAGHEGDGYLTKDTIHLSMHRNCTGTSAFSEAEFIAELRKYNPDDGNDMRQIALAELNVEKAVQEYLRYFDERLEGDNITQRLREMKKELISECNKKVSDYENSKSWKITAPLRSMMKMAKDLFQDTR